MKKYKFTKKYNFWRTDHLENFSYLKWYFEAGYDPCRRYPDSSPQLTFLEIGVFEARTSVFLLDEILNMETNDRTRGILHCIDPDITKNGLYNLRLHTNYVLYDKKSFDILIHLLKIKTHVYDLIYVDGDHNACGLLEDLVLSWKLLKVGGIMLIDDYEMETLDPWFYVSHPEFENNPRLRFTHPRIAIDAFKDIYRGQFDVVIDNYQVGLKKVIDLK